MLFFLPLTTTTTSSLLLRELYPLPAKDISSTPILKSQLENDEDFLNFKGGTQGTNFTSNKPLFKGR